MEKRKRKKTWAQKNKEVLNCYYRCVDKENFSRLFYDNLFYLNPKIELYFRKTDWNHQHKAFMHALDHLFHFSDDKKNFHKTQIIRIAQTHSKKNLNIHPHNYYYWLEALILTMKSIDDDWYDDLEYYLGECLFLPISFVISLYHK